MIKENQARNESNRLEQWRIVRDAWIRHRTRDPLDLTADQRDESRALFAFLDRDNSGTIDIGELRTAFNLLGIGATTAFLSHLFRDIGMREYDPITQEQFARIMTNDVVSGRTLGKTAEQLDEEEARDVEERQRLQDRAEQERGEERKRKRDQWQRRNQIRALFQAIDIDNGGTIEVQEIREAFAVIGATASDEMLHDLFAKVGKTINETVDIDEFAIMMQDTDMKKPAADSMRVASAERSTTRRQLDDKARQDLDARILRSRIRLPFSTVCSSMRRKSLINDAIAKARSIQDPSHLQGIVQMGTTIEQRLQLGPFAADRPAGADGPL